MDKIISILDTSCLKSGGLVKLVPEFYELKNTVENSGDGWHVYESVFDHTISVMSALEKIVSKNRNAKKYLSGKIEKNSKKTLLTAAALLHDIGKKEALTKNGEFTNCQGHEQIGAKKAEVILKRFNLTKKERRRILKIIANHTEFHKLFWPDNQNFNEGFKIIKKNLADIYRELLLLTYADTINSELKNKNPAEFKRRIDFYKTEVRNL